MTKVLIGDKNIETNLKDFRFLNSDSEYEIITSATGKETLEKCRTIKPNIIIMDSSFSDMLYTDIIDKLSTLPSEYNKCNLILTVKNPEHKQLLKNTSILYEILDFPFNSNKAREIITSLKEKYNTPAISVYEVNSLLSGLGINAYSLGSQCLVSAIFKCYYHPEYFFTLDNIYKMVAQEFEISKEEVKNKIRHSIDTVNNSTFFSPESLYIKIFKYPHTISVKMFIQMFVNYLHIIKGKN